jgi:hypothetical protein
MKAEPHHRTVSQNKRRAIAGERRRWWSQEVKDRTNPGEEGGGGGEASEGRNEVSRQRSGAWRRDGEREERTT